MKKKILLNMVGIMTLSLSVAFSPGYTQAETGTENNGEVTVQMGWIQKDGKWYFYDQTGVMKTGWLDDAGKKYFLDANGVMKIGWVLDSGKWYFFDRTGAMKTGWLLDSGKWYFLNQTGAMHLGWVQDGGKWYYLNSTGTMTTGWVLDGGRWYYLDTTGVMKVGWIQSSGKWYYLQATGVMATGWVQDGGKWYFLGQDGVMKTGWIQSAGDWYLLNNSGFISSVLLNAPLISQMPELPRGCEVTSLAMMLQDAGLNVGKMELASWVKKDTTPYSKVNGQTYFGNPNTGFVGDMYSFSKPGYGVYNAPIAELANSYLPNRINNFSGSNFEEIYKHLDSGRPVWVVNNVMFDTVPDQYWQLWQTPTGPIWITMKEHSVLITGYDSQYIYFNDPLAVKKDRKVAIASFKRGWEQMGRQAITYR